MNDVTNLGFDPAGKFLVDGNDKIIVESFDSLTNGVTIKDPSGKDFDVLSIALSDNTTNTFTVKEMKGIETLHVDVSGAADTIGSFNGTIEGLATLELAGASTKEFTISGSLPTGLSKIDASAMTSNVNLDATVSGATTLIGGTSSVGDKLTISKEGGTMTGNVGPDTFYVSNAVNKLVTITDIAKGDVVNFGTAVTQNAKAKELTVADSADETTFIANLQKAADVEATANGLFYGIYNGNTYVVANGKTSKNVNLDEAKKSLVANSKIENQDFTFTVTAGDNGTDGAIKTATEKANVTSSVTIKDGVATLDTKTFSVTVDGKDSTKSGADVTGTFAAGTSTTLKSADGYTTTLDLSTNLAGDIKAGSGDVGANTADKVTINNIAPSITGDPIATTDFADAKKYT